MTADYSKCIITVLSHQLLRNYKTDPIIANYVNKLDWFILPVMNPDGYEYSRAEVSIAMLYPCSTACMPRHSQNDKGFKSHFDWRKNRRPPSCGKPAICCYGVDLNRNFGYRWGGKP